MKENTVSEIVLSNRIAQLIEHKDYLFRMRDFAATLPEVQQQELNQKIGHIADLLAWEAEELRKWNLEQVTKH